MVGQFGRLLQSDVLKLGHHGSKTSSSDEFLGAVNPEFVVISAGCDNQYGHPHTEVLERVDRFGATRVATCKDGTIVFRSDGVSITR